MSRLSLPPHRPARGAASLIVVMVLMFVVSLVAAYTSRNLVFEQRTTSNLYRSTQAAEVAEAALDWAISMLNSGRIDAACAPTTDVNQTTFRDRYLNINVDNGLITEKKTSTGGILLPSCVFSGTDRQCDCPLDGAPTLVAPVDTQVHPAFRVRFVPLQTVNQQPGLVRIEAVACTRLFDDCLNFYTGGPGGTLSGTDSEARAFASVLVGLAGGPRIPPGAALSAYGNVTLGGGFLYGDVAVLARGAINTGGATLQLPAGSAGGSPTTYASYAPLQATGYTAERFFAAVFNAWPATFRQQPAALALDCNVVNCNAQTLRDAATVNPGRPIWVDGDLSLDTPGDIGSAIAPVAVVVTGQVNASSSATIRGLLFVDAANWNDAGTTAVSGALLAGGNILAGSPSVAHDLATLNRMRWTTGSWVRVPGSWRDFQP